MGIPWIGRCLLGAALLAPLVGGMAASPELARAQSAACPAIVVPAYFDDPGTWTAMTDASRVDLVVVNPASGVGKRRSEATANRVAESQAAGARVIGYVQTDLGTRKPKAVRREILKYWRWYGVDGIYLDEVSSAAKRLPYYRKLSGYIRNGEGGGFVMLNPGFTPAEGYMAIADVVQNYEFFHNRYARQEFPEWVDNYPASRFAHVVHDVPNAAAMAATLLEARGNNAGYVFVTDRDNPQQYRGLPGFWDETLSILCR
jgi:hypothetical protein